MFCFPKVGEPSAEVLQALKNAGIKEQRARKNAVLLREGENNNRIIILDQGYVKITKMDLNGNIKLLALGHSQALGLAGFFQKKEYPATVTALTECSYFSMWRNDLQVLMDEAPVIRDYFLESMDEFVSYYIWNSVMQTYDSTKVQLAGILLDIMEEIGKPMENGEMEIPLALTDEILSNFLGSSRETVTRILGKWREAGWIDKKKRCLVIHDSDNLRAVINSN